MKYFQSLPILLLSSLCLVSCKTSRTSLSHQHDSLVSISSSVCNSQMQHHSLFDQVTGSQFQFDLTSFTFDPAVPDSLGRPSLVGITHINGHSSDSTHTKTDDAVISNSSSVFNDSITHDSGSDTERHSQVSSDPLLRNALIFSAIDFASIILLLLSIYLYFRGRRP